MHVFPFLPVMDFAFRSQDSFDIDCADALMARAEMFAARLQEMAGICTVQYTCGHRTFCTLVVYHLERLGVEHAWLEGGSTVLVGIRAPAAGMMLPV